MLFYTENQHVQYRFNTLVHYLSILVINAKGDQYEIKAFYRKLTHKYMISLFAILEYQIIILKVELKRSR